LAVKGSSQGIYYPFLQDLRPEESFLQRYYLR